MTNLVLLTMVGIITGASLVNKDLTELKDSKGNRLQDDTIYFRSHDYDTDAFIYLNESIEEDNGTKIFETYSK